MGIKRPRIYQGKFDQGCHVCGGYPNSPKIKTKSLYRCTGCGFYTCEKHLRHQLMKKMCPNCHDHRLKPILNHYKNKKVKAGGMPEHLASDGVKGNAPKGGAGNLGSFGFSERKEQAEKRKKEAEEATINLKKAKEELNKDKKKKKNDTDEAAEELGLNINLYTAGTNYGDTGKGPDKRNALATLRDLSIDINLQSGEGKTNTYSAEEHGGNQLSRIQSRNQGRADLTINLNIGNYAGAQKMEIKQKQRKLLGMDNVGQIEAMYHEIPEINEFDFQKIINELNHSVNVLKKANMYQEISLADACYIITGNDMLESYLESLEKYTKEKPVYSILALEASNPILMEKYTKASAENLDLICALGYGPRSVLNNKNLDVYDLKKQFKEMPSALAIGTIGLDLHFAPYTIEEQEKIFRQQLKLANELQVPVLITSKDADKEIGQIIESMDISCPVIFASVIHTKETFQMCLDHDFYVLIRPEVTYPDQDNYQEFIYNYPNKKLLLSSAEEHVPPYSKHGTWNKPEYLEETGFYTSGLFRQETFRFMPQLVKNFLTMIGYPYEDDDEE